MLFSRLRRVMTGVCLAVGSFLLAAALVVSFVTQPVLFLPEAPPIGGRVDPEALRAHVRKLAVELAPRDASHVSNLDAAAHYIASELESSGPDCSLGSYDGDRFRNVHCLLGGEDGERIVLGAHYDAARGTPGADDNASGVAALIEIGRLLAALEHSRTIELVAYTLEEQPFFDTATMGSAVHARALSERGVEVRAMISLEMLGYYDDAPSSQTYPISGLTLLYPQRGNFIGVVGSPKEVDIVRTIKGVMRAAGSVPVYSINAPGALPGLSLSDHASFWKVGYAAVMITDTAFARNPHYHQPSDTPETLDYVRMATVAEQVASAVRKLAGAL